MSIARIKNRIRTLSSFDSAVVTSAQHHTDPAEAVRAHTDKAQLGTPLLFPY